MLDQTEKLFLTHLVYFSVICLYFKEDLYDQCFYYVLCFTLDQTEKLFLTHLVYFSVICLYFNPIRPGLFSRSPGPGGAQRPRWQKSRLTSTY